MCNIVECRKRRLEYDQAAPSVAHITCVIKLLLFEKDRREYMRLVVCI